MDQLLQKRLTRLAGSGLRHPLSDGLKGIEKESLRINRDGSIATSPHPDELGSALTNRYITTDFSEALLEFITRPYKGAWEVVQSLCDIHQFVYAHLEDELLWVTSMPCTVQGDVSIPVARYGDSNVGRMKHVYRVGLGHRYGRVMQTIAGVHFNYSVPQRLWPVLQEIRGDKRPLVEFVSVAYFGLLRNFRRHGWLMLYLFGASPAVCKSFVADGGEDLQELDPGTLYAPYATSLRMSELGYKNKNQSSLEISLDNMDAYTADLTRALHTSLPEYEKIGTVVDGDYRQLSTGYLQIENEYYGLARPKRVARSGESPTHALHRGGVEYIEVRALDVNTFDPIGIHRNQMLFMEAFLLFCLLTDSPPLATAELAELDHRHSVVAKAGRKPGLEVPSDGRSCALDRLGRDILDGMRGICELLDDGRDGQPYGVALEDQTAAFDDVSRTPSARILDELLSMRESFFAFAMRMAESHSDYFRNLDMDNNAAQNVLSTEAHDSIQRQRAIEAGDTINFEQYLANYYAQTKSAE